MRVAARVMAHLGIDPAWPTRPVLGAPATGRRIGLEGQRALS